MMHGAYSETPLQLLYGAQVHVRGRVVGNVDSGTQTVPVSIITSGCIFFFEIWSSLALIKSVHEVL